jgi:hypothetical protein
MELGMMFGMKSIGLLSACVLGLSASLVRAEPAVAGGSPAAKASDWITIDPFETADGWKLITSDGVKASVSVDTESFGSRSLKIDYEFTKGTGFCIVQRAFPVDLGENYEFCFNVWGKGPSNNLEFKLLDPSTENVWWNVKRDHTFSTAPTRTVYKRRNLQFAWGPSGGAPMTKLGYIELAISSSSGGSGTVSIDRLQFRPLPASKPYTGTPVITASSVNDPTSAAKNVLDGKPGTCWRPHPNDKKKQLTIDFGEPRDFGGIKMTWAPGSFSPQTFIDLSDDGQEWRNARIFGKTRSSTDYLRLADERARYVRFSTESAPNQKTLSLDEITFLPVENGSSMNDLYSLIARESPRGFFPRYFLGEQRYWTVVGSPTSKHEALLSEDGTLEPFKRGFSIEPFIRQGSKLLTWADAELSQSLADNSLPIPTVVRKMPGLTLAITAFARGESPDTNLFAKYALTNTTNEQQVGDLVLMYRPFQVLPPWQALNIEGGVAKVRRMDSRLGYISVDDRLTLFSRPHDFLVGLTSDDGDPTRLLTAQSYSTDLPLGSYVECGQNLASSIVRFRFVMGPGESRTWYIGLPLDRINASEGIPAPDSTFNGPFAKYAEDQLAACKAEWADAVNRVRFTVPAEGQHLIDTFKSQLGFVLINRDGPALQPGSRTYDRSWARDGSMGSAALLEVGLTEQAKAWIDWFGEYQFESGKIPCVVDSRGPDPVPEHDSTGQYIWAVANYYAFTKDKDFLKAHWPRVQLGVEYIKSLRAQRMTSEFAKGSSAVRQEPGKPAVPASAFYGLVPESISHEGYSAKPMHSYWDGLFTMRGLKDAATIAEAMNDAAKAKEYAALAADFRESLANSFRATAKAHGIDYLAGCVELGDFDSTSSTVALFPCDEGDSLPQDLLTNTFERSWQNFVKRRDTNDWKDYTPYELRHVGAYVRLGWKDRAQELLKFYFNDQRPKGWNQWAEVVWRDERAPKFIGDMPHTWVGSDYLNSVCAMFAFERGRDQSLVVFAGIPAEWFAKGVGASGLRTRFGSLDVQGSKDGNAYQLTIKDGMTLPTGGIIVSPPEAGKAITSATINGEKAALNERGEVVIKTLPATVRITQ